MGVPETAPLTGAAFPHGTYIPHPIDTPLSLLQHHLAMTTTDSIILTRLNKELRTLEKREADLSARIEDMQHERTSIRARVSELTKARTLYQEFGADSPDDDGPHATVKTPALAQAPLQSHASANTKASLPTTADLAERVMVSQGGRAKIRDILDEAVRIGKLAGKDGDYGSVFGTLKGNPRRFVKVGPGQFALVTTASSEGK